MNSLFLSDEKVKDIAERINSKWFSVCSFLNHRQDFNINNFPVRNQDFGKFVRNLAQHRPDVLINIVNFIDKGVIV